MIQTKYLRSFIPILSKTISIQLVGIIVLLWGMLGCSGEEKVHTRAPNLSKPAETSQPINQLTVTKPVQLDIAPVSQATVEPFANEPIKTPVAIFTPTPIPTIHKPTLKPRSSVKDIRQTPLPTVPTKTFDPSSRSVLPSPDFSKSEPYPRFAESIENQLSNVLNAEFSSAMTKVGISAAVYQGEKLWTESIGISKLSEPMLTTTPIGIKSTSKTFLAALILTQIEDGLYELDDRLSNLLKDNLSYQNLNKTNIPNASVRELLTMTSGISEANINSFAGFMMMGVSPTWEPSDNLELIDAKPQEPGGFHYTNVSSDLLGMIAEDFGGNDLSILYRDAFLDDIYVETVLLPNTAIPEEIASPHDYLSQFGGAGGFGDLTDIPAFSKIGFIRADGRSCWAGCGIISTAENMARWGYELFSPSGRAISSHVRNQLTNSFMDNAITLAGGPQHYGYHVARKEHGLSDGSRIITYGHPGGGAGYASVLFYSPSEDLSISLLANSDLGQAVGTCAAVLDKHWLNPLDCISIGLFEAMKAK